MIGICGELALEEKKNGFTFCWSRRRRKMSDQLNWCYLLKIKTCLMLNANLVLSLFAGEWEGTSGLKGW